MKSNPNFDYLHSKIESQRVTLLQGGTRCFIGSTLVNTPTGLIAIKDIAIGQPVYSYNSEGKVECRNVVNKFLYKNAHSLHKLITLVLVNGQKITSTYEHRHLQSNGYVEAIDIGIRAVEAGAKFTNEIHGEQHGQDSRNELQKGKACYDNETSIVGRLFKNDAINKRKIQNNTSAPDGIKNVVGESAKQTTGKSHKPHSNRQPGREFGMGYAQRKYSAHDECGKANVQQRREKRDVNNDHGKSKRGPLSLHSVCDYGKRLGEGIWNFNSANERNITAQKLETSCVKEVILHEYEGTVYDIEVERNHNFLITPQNYVTHNSGKTFSAIYFLIDYCLLYTSMEIDIVRDTFTALKSTAWKDFVSVLVSCNLYDERNHNKTDHIYTLNGNTISYYGADNPDKIHGRSRDILWINEAHQFPESTIDQLFPRTRYRIICDYNPALGLSHWLDKYIIQFPPIITTYVDNPFLTADQIADIESRQGNKYWWKIYGCGERAAREGAIFENWAVGEFDKTLSYCYGQDYGFSIDPTTLLKVAIDKAKKIVYCHELLYSNSPMGTDAILSTNKSLIERPNDLIVADSAEPRLISDLKNKGLNIIGCSKGPGSIVAGITALQDYKLIITDSSANLKTELSNYIWNDKKAGIPFDAFNHLLDPLRYCFTELNTTARRHTKTAGARIDWG